MGFFDNTIAAVFGSVIGTGKGVLPIFERADGTGFNAKAGSHDGLQIESSDFPTQITAITKSDDTNVTSTTARGLLVSVAGDLAVRGVGSTTTVTIAVTAGQWVPCQVSRVMAATTATVVGLS